MSIDKPTTKERMSRMALRWAFCLLLAVPGVWVFYALDGLPHTWKGAALTASVVLCTIVAYRGLVLSGRFDAQIDKLEGGSKKSLEPR